MNQERIDCADALALLQDFLKEELTAANQERVATHLAACRHCHGQADFQRNFLAALARATRGVKCPEQVAARIRQALRSDPTG